MQYSFPPVSPFLELVRRAEQLPEKIILRDHSSGKTATAGQLLRSVSFLRGKLKAILVEKGIHDAKNANDDRFIFLIAPPGWDYVVSMLAIFSLRVAISPQSIIVRPEEVLHFIKLAKPIALLYVPAFSQKVDAIKSLCAEEGSGVDPEFSFVEIETAYPHTLASLDCTIELSSGTSYTHTGSLFFTSGTSGNQKGVVHSFEALLASARERVETWKLTENDVVLNQKPGNWIGGIFGIIPSLIAGACLEPCAGVFNPKWFWERISQGGVSVFDIAAIGYDRLGQYFDEHIDVLPPSQKEPYLQGIISARVASVSGSLLPPHTQRRWTELRRGKPLLNLYGSTEMTIICSMRWENPNYIDMCSVGPPVPGVEIKLVKGEMRLKAPSMFSRYISDDPAQTEIAFDSEGFFKSGDCAEKLGDSYRLHGRANIDVLHFWGFTLHTGEIENALFCLPYINNAVVLPLEDEDYQERAAAILQVKPEFQSKQPDLDALRKDLTEKTGLMLFKQPTVVYWLQEGEEISLTVNGKISKIDARKKFFSDRWRCMQRVEVLDLTGMEYWRMGGQC